MLTLHLQHKALYNSDLYKGQNRRAFQKANFAGFPWDLDCQFMTTITKLFTTKNTTTKMAAEFEGDGLLKL